MTNEALLRECSNIGQLAPRKILITGGDGMLGRAFARQLKTHAPDVQFKALGKNELDVTDAQQLGDLKDWIQGGWIVHCAALVNVESCAHHPNVARNIIVDGTRNAVELAKQTGARFMYPQSFLIYDGQLNPIPENESPRPLSLYGQLKFEAENLVKENIPDALIIRMAGFFGGDEKDKNFVGRIIPNIVNRIQNGQSTLEVGDRVWQPTWTEDLALNTLILMARECTGSYQMACHGYASFYELTAAIVEMMGWSHLIKILPVHSSAVSQNELGRRPNEAVLSCDRLNREGLDFQRPWAEALQLYLARPYFDLYKKIDFRLQSTTA